MRIWKVALATGVTVASLTGLLISGCSSGSGSGSAPATSTTLTLSGTLGSSMTTFANNTSMAVDLSNLKIQAIAFTTPPTIANADVNADGSFAVSLPASIGAATTAYFLDKTDDSQVGMIVFEDTSLTDMNGNTSQTSSVVLGDSVNLGAVNLGTDGKVKIPVATVAAALGSSSSVAAGTAFDPTGTWYMKAFDGTMPTGYQTVGLPCTDGPCVGFPLTLIRYSGKLFTPNSGQCDPQANPVVCAVTDGTVGSNDRYGLSIWGGNVTQGVAACGGVTGFSAAEARAGGRIHLTNPLPTIGATTMAFGPYTYTKGAAFGGDVAPFNKDWMPTGATLTHDLHNCRPKSVTNGSNSYSGWACQAEIMTGPWPGAGSGNFGWQVGLEGGGCFNTANNKPVNVTNWENLGYGNCVQNDVSSTYGAGFVRNVCSYTNVDHDNSGATPLINMSCTHTGGQMTDAAGAPTSTPLTLAMGEYLGQATTLATATSTCASIGSATDAQKLAAYRCYAEAYWGTNPGASTCGREYHFNWAATTPEDFAKDDDRGRPRNAFITNILNYSADGQTATLEDEEINTITVNTGAASSTFCKASRRTVISFKKISATRILVDLRESGQMNSTNAACIGAAKDALAGKDVGGGDLQHMLMPQNMMFYADTTP